MKIAILKCQNCGSYGLREQCSCGGKRIKVKPAKYSPIDPYAKYRRIEKARILGIKWHGE
ncbi:ribosome biogenesis protein [Candidatus Woesearchaeota archaeon]|nr:ribosome biogenesis protein [Candidatus Woesearchaeota archaeon]